jgi:hypothetical protein
MLVYVRAILAEAAMIFLLFFGDDIGRGNIVLGVGLIFAEFSD